MALLVGGSNPMPSHQWLDQRSLALHRLIAKKIRRDPDLFENVKKTIILRNSYARSDRT